MDVESCRGEVGDENDGELDFKLSEDILIPSNGEPIDAIFISTYPSLLSHIGDGKYFQGRVILAPTNKIVL